MSLTIALIASGRPVTPPLCSALSSLATAPTQRRCRRNASRACKLCLELVGCASWAKPFANMDTSTFTFPIRHGAIIFRYLLMLGSKCASTVTMTPKNSDLDFDGMVEDIREMPPGSCVLLHACAHNPTGMDPSLEQWKRISDVSQGKETLAVF